VRGRLGAAIRFPFPITPAAVPSTLP
jgi:hypothetical protein